MKPTPAQARLLQLLRDEPTKKLRVLFGRVRLAEDNDRWRTSGPDIETSRTTVMACLRLGWLDRTGTDSSDWGAGPSYYRITLEGQASIMNLRPQDFISPKHEPGPSVKGEAAKVIRALARRHESENGWIFLTEAPGGVDALAVSAWMSNEYKCVGYEVKVSRSDFLGELRNPEKTKRTAAYCSHFFFACQAGLIKAAEIPDPYGLVYVNRKGTTRMVKRSSMPKRDPTWGFVGALIRRIAEIHELPAISVLLPVEAIDAALPAF